MVHLSASTINMTKNRTTITTANMMIFLYMFIPGKLTLGIETPSELANAVPIPLPSVGLTSTGFTLGSS